MGRSIRLKLVSQMESQAHPVSSCGGFINFTIVVKIEVPRVIHIKEHDGGTQTHNKLVDWAGE